VIGVSLTVCCLLGRSAVCSAGLMAGCCLRCLLPVPLLWMPTTCPAVVDPLMHAQMARSSCGTCASSSRL